MNVKLTLRMDEEVIEKGKRFASSNGKSLSQLVHDYFIMLDSEGSLIEEVPVSPKLLSLVGIGAGPYDEQDYQAHLEKKYG